MAKQLFLNNFETVFVSSVKDTPVTGTPATELDYGVLRVSDGAAGVLLNPSNGDYYVLTAYKRSGSVESDIEVMRVTSVNNATPGECRISVERAQEGTKALGYVAGDHLALRWTRGGAENVVQELALKAPLASPTFTGTVGGITKAMVGLGNVDNTSDADKPVSTAQATAISASTATNIHAALSKATPVDADELGLSDSAATWGLKKLTFADLKAWIGSFFVSKSGDTITGNLNFGGVGRRITGDFSDVTVANRVTFQTSTANGNTNVGVLPNGTAVVAAVRAYGASDPTNASVLDMAVVGGSDARITSAGLGTGTSLPMTFYIGNAERLRIDASGNVLVTGSGGLGYGVGSGGTVTQATSKSTAVTLNKPSGKITMHNEALAPGAQVAYTLTNSFVSAADTVVATIVNSSCSAGAYALWVSAGPGFFNVYLKNISAGSLSESLAFNYTVIKGATA